MASGDTKTEAMLNALGNGGSADEFRGCCNTKTQQYILDAIDRVQNVEDEVEELKNNPDVVDIVDTYADLQAYDTRHLTDNDIIRVLTDETHSGNSTYYKFNKQAGTWTFIGEIASAGGDIKTLSTDDYNYPTNNPDRVALWLLPNGLYRIPASGVSVYYASNSVWTPNHGNFVIIEKNQAGTKPITMYFFGSTDGVEYCEVSTSGTLNRALAYTILSDRVSQSTGNSQYSVMSQNAVTSMVFADPSTMQKIKIGSGTYATPAENSIEIGRDARAQSSGGVAIGANSMLLNSLSHFPIAIGDSASAYGDYAISIGQGTSTSGTRGIAIGGSANVTQNGAIALGYGSSTSSVGEMNIGSSSTSYGYNSTNYRLLSGVHDPVNDHDAATKGYVDAHAGGPTVVQAIGSSTTDVMSQNATSTMIYDYVNNSTHLRPKIGNNAAVGGLKSMAIGDDSSAYGQNAVALGGSANTHMHQGAIALGYGSSTSADGEMNIGTSDTSFGYSSSNYRLLSGLYDGQSAHDAATLAQGNTLASSAPTTSTVGVLGQLYTDTTGMHTYQCTAISGDTYTWTQRW